MSFWGELKRRNVFKVAVAYLVASWLIVQVIGVLTEPLNLPDVLDTIVVVLLAIGFPFALIIAWIYEVTPEGVRVTASAGGAVAKSSTSGKRLTFVVVVLFVLAIGLMAVNRFTMTPIPEGFTAGSRLAILPCTDLSPDPSAAYFAPGMHQELIRQISSLRGLEVISGSSVQRYSGGQVPAPQVAEELDVQAVMECTALYSGNQVRLTTLLVDGTSGTSLWSSVYPGDMSNLSGIFQIQADIAMQVANALRVSFLEEEREQIERPPTQSRAAYEFYLAARAQNPNQGGGPRAVILLEQALENDPEFALAWSQKSVALRIIFITMEEGDGGSTLAAAMEAAENAVRLAPNQGHGYAARAQVRATQRDWLGAEQDWKAAQERGFMVDDTEYHAEFLLSAGFFEGARAALELTLDTDPLNSNAQYYLLLSHELLGDAEAADAIYRRGQELLVSPGLLDAGSTFVRLGRGEVGPGYDPVSIIGGVAANEAVRDPIGGLADLRRLTADQEQKTPVRRVNHAVLAAYLEDPDFALQLLVDSVSEAGSGLLIYMAWLPVFDEVRQLSAFRDLVRDIGLVEYWQTNGWPEACSELGGDDFFCG